MSNFDETLMKRLTKLEREVERLKVKESPMWSEPNGWIPVSATWTYASATTITVPSGAASIYSVGDKIKLNNTDLKYFYIVGVADTVLTITGGSNYTLDSDAILAVYYSKAATPLGFPQWFTYIPAYQDGWTALPTGGYYRFAMYGKTVYCHISMGAGTSNSVEAAIGLPTNAANISWTNRGTWGWGMDNGVQVNPAGGYFIDTTNHAIKFFKTSIHGSGWTASGTKRIYCTFFYEAA